MKTIQIEKIKIGENIRADYGDLTELAASIRINGVRNPVELSSEGELIDGFRRVKAAKAAGLAEVPYFVNEQEIGKTKSQIISGIFQMNLNPIEEGQAFRKYMDKKRLTAKGLSIIIQKTEQYIEKRLVLVNLPEDVKRALIEKKILMGHALLLAKFTKQDSSKYLRDIMRNKRSVENAREGLEYGEFSARLVDAKFDTKPCKDCKYNGSVQSELFETGKVLNGTCMNPDCFKRKIKELIKQRKEEFKDVLFKGDQYETPKGYQNAEYDYQLTEKGITKEYMSKCRKDKENYLVRIRENGSIQEFFKIPTKKEKADGSKNPEKAKEKVSTDNLATKVNEFKKEFLIKKSVELMQPGTKEAKALTLINLMKSADWYERDEFNKVFKIKSIKEIYGFRELTIETAISYLSRKAFRLVDMKELIEISRNFKVDVKKHFEITEDYLKMYTKDQLKSLIKEFKLQDSEKDLKKGELIDHILKQKLKGKVPKIMQ